MSLAGQTQIERFERIVSELRFRDWQILVRPDGERGAYLQVQFEAPDSCTGEAALQRGRKWRLSEHMTDAEVVQTAFAAVLAAVEHEAREDFTYRGRAIFGPHFVLDALVEAVDRGRLSHREERS